MAPAGLGKEEQLELAQKILREASAGIPKLADANFPAYGPAWVPNHKVQMLEKVAKVQGEFGDQEGLRETADRAIQTAKTHRSSIYHLSVIGDKQVNAGYLEDGVRTAEAALESVRFNLQKRNMDAWLPLIAGVLLRGGNIEKALEAARLIANARDRAFALHNIGLDLRGKGETIALKLLEESQALIADLDDTKAKTSYWIYGASRLYELKKEREAEKQLSLARKLALEVPEIERQAWLYREIAELEYKWGRKEHFERTAKEAARTIDLIPDPGSRVAQYVDLADLFHQASFHDQAEEILRKAKGYVLLGKDPHSKVQGSLSIAEMERKLGNIQKAKKLIHQAVNALEAMEKPDRIGIAFIPFWYQGELMELLTLKDLKRIEQKTHSLVPDEPWQGHIDQWALASLQAKQGLFEQAMHTTNQIKGAPSSKGFSIQLIGKELAQANGLEKALAWATKLPSPVEKIYAHIGIAEGTIRAKN